MKPEILVMERLRPVAMERLERDYALHRYDEAADKEAFLREIGGRVRGIATSGHVTLDAAVLEHLPKLEVVACVSAGFESIDAAALKARGIPMSNTSDALCDDVADCAMMLLLAARRQLIRGHDYVKSGEWGRSGPLPLFSATKGRKLGIAGLGTIGKAIAKRAEPFGMEIAYFGRSKKDVAYRFEPDLVKLADWADILVVATAGGAGTLKLVDDKVLRALGPKGTVVNISRGTVIDEEAMIAALADGGLGSAGLDVFLNEPNADRRFADLPNVTLYPHHASGTVETRDDMALMVCDNLDAHFAGKPLPNPAW